MKKVILIVISIIECRLEEGHTWQDVSRETQTVFDDLVPNEDCAWRMASEEEIVETTLIEVEENEPICEVDGIKYCSGDENT